MGCLRLEKSENRNVFRKQVSSISTFLYTQRDSNYQYYIFSKFLNYEHFLIITFAEEVVCFLLAPLLLVNFILRHFSHKIVVICDSTKIHNKSGDLDGKCSLYAVTKKIH